MLDISAEATQISDDKGKWQPFPLAFWKHTASYSLTGRKQRLSGFQSSLARLVSKFKEGVSPRYKGKEAKPEQNSSKSSLKTFRARKKPLPRFIKGKMKQARMVLTRRAD